MIITVYAIAKNEEKFAARWAASMREADNVVVLDTGSTDGTVEILKAAGVIVTQKTISPWRFDRARNESLKLVPPDTDVCVCTDLDEVFEEGWREKLEREWLKVDGAQQGRYRYIWSHPDGKPGVEFLIEKAHALKGFKWVNPVHEVLRYTGGGLPRTVTLYGVTLHHYPDDGKSRASYLPLLELAVAEDPDNDRNVHYLGREYMFYGRYADAIETLEKHLALPSATWTDERAASMRYIARCHMNLGHVALAERWYLRAVAEAPNLREPAVDYAKTLFDRGDWHGTVFFLKKALAITARSNSYINEPAAWGALPYDLISLAYYYLGDYENAIFNVDEAIKLSDDPRLTTNRRFFLTAAAKV